MKGVNYLFTDSEYESANELDEPVTPLPKTVLSSTKLDTPVNDSSVHSATISLNQTPDQ